MTLSFKNLEIESEIERKYSLRKKLTITLFDYPEVLRVI